MAHNSAKKRCMTKIQTKSQKRQLVRSFYMPAWWLAAVCAFAAICPANAARTCCTSTLIAPKPSSLSSLGRAGRQCHGLSMPPVACMLHNVSSLDCANGSLAETRQEYGILGLEWVSAEGLPFHLWTPKSCFPLEFGPFPWITWFCCMALASGTTYLIGRPGP